MAEALVRIQALDGTWEQLGTGNYPGVTPEEVSVHSDSWGYESCSFKLKRDPKRPQPDLMAYTPCEIDEGGIRIFEGRIRETPGQAGDSPEIDVQGQGWQHHLDDDVFETSYVHSRLSDWTDQRSLAAGDRVHFRTAGFVEAGVGSLAFGWREGDTIQPAHSVGATLDMKSQSAKYVEITYDVLHQSGFIQLYTFIVGHNSQDATEPGLEVGVFQEDSTTANGRTLVALFSQSYRYVTVYYYHKAADAAVTVQAPSVNRIDIRKVLVVSQQAYIFNAESDLRASWVIVDALSRAPLLSQNTELVAGTLFKIPDASPDGPLSPRESMEAANVYQGMRLRVGRDRKLDYNLFPTIPKYLVGSWGSEQFQVASLNSATEIYNRAVCTATDRTGQPIRIERWASQQPGVIREPIASPSLTTSQVATANGTYKHSYSGTFNPGTTYYFEIPMTVTSLGTTYFPTMPVARVALRDGVNGPYVTGDYRLMALGGAPRSETVIFTLIPKAPITLLYLEVQSLNSGTVNWGTANGNAAPRLQRVAPTLIDRRGFVRTKVVSSSDALTVEAATAVLDVFLQTHMRTPFKGQGTIQVGDLRAFEGGGEVHPRLLSRDIGELIHFSNLIDPDTGAGGRDGVITDATYDSISEQAVVTIDSTRDDLETLLARIGVLQGQG